MECFLIMPSSDIICVVKVSELQALYVISSCVGARPNFVSALRFGKSQMQNGFAVIGCCTKTRVANLGYTKKGRHDVTSVPRIAKECTLRVVDIQNTPMRNASLAPSY